MLREFHFENDISNIKSKITLTLDEGKKGYVCAINAYILMNSYKDKLYRKTISEALFSVCDGVNVKRINNWTRDFKIKVLPGPDIFENIVKENTFKQYFLGSTEDILNGLKGYVKKHNVNISEDMFFSPPFLQVDQFDYQEIADRINDLSPDIVWVGLGAPKQEIFMQRILPYIKNSVLIGVGAAFMFYSEIKGKKRAPLWLRKFRLEWLYRLINEPKKILPRQIKTALYLPQILIHELIEK